MPDDPQSFLPRWHQSEAAERANYVLFLTELCDFLDLPRPEPTQADEHRNTYVFEKAVQFKNPDGTVSQGRIDLYRRARFVLEAKQGSNRPILVATDDAGNLILTEPQPRPLRTRRGTAIRGTEGWDQAMLEARGQAELYAKALPVSEGWPPFLITVDVGHSIELFADFSLTGKAYLPFPDPRSYRILLSQLEVPALRDRLRAVWLTPTRWTPHATPPRSPERSPSSWPPWPRTLSETATPPGRLPSSSPAASSPPSPKTWACSRMRPKKT